jgi:hypothetical protein
MTAKLGLIYSLGCMALASSNTIEKFHQLEAPYVIRFSLQYHAPAIVIFVNKVIADAVIQAENFIADSELVKCKISAVFVKTDMVLMIFLLAELYSWSPY